MEKKIFFQSSLPRAGSTLLQNIIGQNPEFYVTPTSGVLELAYFKFFYCINIISCILIDFLHKRCSCFFQYFDSAVKVTS